MFWGLIMEPNKRYTQTVEKPFHISQAAMDTSTGDGDFCQVMVVVDGKNFLVCTLQKNKNIQVPLDLYFKTGDVVSFLTNGKSNIHLTGYLDPDFDGESDGEEEEGEEEEEEEAPELVPAKNKRKLDASVEGAAKKLKQEAKKKLVKKDDSDDEDSSDDDEGADDLQRLLDGDIDSDENDESFKLNSTAGDSDDSEESDEEVVEEAAVEEEEEETADTSKKLSKNQKKRLKKLQKEGKAAPTSPAQTLTNGVDKKKKDGAQEKPKAKEGKPENKQASPEKREHKQLSGGVHIEDLKVGSGPVAKAGKLVQVYYEGRLKQNNKMFDNCNKGPGFKFRLGSKEVITGWDVGVAGMKVGGKRKIVCPPAMAYGAKGSPPVIPPNSTLVFEVELKNVK